MVKSGAMRASADRALALNAVYCDRLDEMDLPLLKNDITRIFLGMIRVFLAMINSVDNARGNQPRLNGF